VRRRRPSKADNDAEVQNDDDDERHDAVRDEFEVLEDVHHKIVVVVGIARQRRTVAVQTHRPEDVDVVGGDEGGQHCRRQPVDIIDKH